MAVFTLSNDSLVLENDEKEDFPNLNEDYREFFLEQFTYPAVNIGHLGVRHDLQSMGIGDTVVRYVWTTFSEYDITGCQFITVDSLNNARTNKFYSRLGFQNQTNKDHMALTRRMFLELFTHL